MRTALLHTLAALALLLALPLHAGEKPVSEEAMRIESSLMVEGTIDVNAAGEVVGYELKDADRLPASVRELAAKAIENWVFEPVALAPGTSSGRARMGIRVVAHKLADGAIALRIGSAYFGGSVKQDGRRSRALTPPKYPFAAAAGGVGASVYTAVHVDREGRVTEAVAEQVNMKVYGRESDLMRWRELMARATLQAVLRWRFDPPTGEADDDGLWTYRIPVDYIPPGTQPPAPGQWEAYVPGPRTPIPWRKDRDMSAPDALAGGGVYPADGLYRLSTPLSSSF